LDIFGLRGPFIMTVATIGREVAPIATINEELSFAW
jgi:hypothetical protein